MSTRIADGQQPERMAPLVSDKRDSSLLFGMTAVAALLLGHVPLVMTYFRRLILFEHYEFVPLLGIGVCVLFWLRVKEIPRDEIISGMRAGVPVSRLLIGCGTLTVASILCSPWVAMVSLIITLGLILNSLAGNHWKALLPVWGLTFLMVRPPLHLDLTLITRLQLETSHVASTVLESMGVMHLMEGNVLAVPHRRFLVEEACSGIHSVFALLTAAAFYAVCMRTPLFRGVLLMVSAIFWACFMNLVRIAATIFAFEQLQVDLSEGWVHSVTGIVTFFVAVIFLAFTDQMLRFFLDPINPHKVSYWEQDGNPFVKMWNGTKSRRRSEKSHVVPSTRITSSGRLPSQAIAVGVAGLSVVAVFWQVNALKAETLGMNAPVAIAGLTPGSLPARLGDWVQQNFTIEHRKQDPVYSDVSKIWTYRGPSHGALVSIDYPFRGWHELTICYRAQGWEIDSYRSVPLASMSGHSLSEVQLHRPTGERGVLLFVVMDAHGRPLGDPAVESFWMQTVGRAIERLQRPFAASFPKLAPNSSVTTQLQMLITSAGNEIPSVVREEARGHFSTLHAELAGMLTSDMTVAMKEEAP